MNDPISEISTRFPVAVRSLPRIGLLMIGIFFVPTVSADVFLLKGGGKFEGTLQNLQEVPRKTYRVEGTDGWIVDIEARYVDRVRKGERETLVEYDAFAPFEKDTIENHLKIAAWCRENHLPELSQKHLLRILEHDPEHREARQLLGHFKADDGTWTTRQEFLGRSGYTRDKTGSYRTRQQIEVEEILERRKKAAVFWEKRISQLRGVLPGNGKARDELLALDDPEATRSLFDALTSERNEDIRIMLIKALSNIKTSAALHMIAQWAISPKEKNRDVREACFEELRKHPAALPAIIGFYTSQLNPALCDNRTINHAAFALGQLDAKTAIPFLIDALETVHQQNVVIRGPAPAFGGDGNMVMGGGQRQVNIKNNIKNTEVLGALVRITGVNFQYDKNTWKAWLIESRRSESFNARRGG